MRSKSTTLTAAALFLAGALLAGCQTSDAGATKTANSGGT